MSYYEDLAAALRTRKCSEQQVKDVLEAVREAHLAGGADPEQEFGPARTYAENFAGERGRTPAQLVRLFVPLVAVVLMFVLRVLLFPGLPFFPWGLLLGVGAFVLVSAVGEGVVSRTNRRMPDGFAAPTAALT